MKTPLFFILTAITLLSSLSRAAEPPPRDWGFQPLEIYDFKNGTALLRIADLNGDGLDDIIFANNHVSRLEILLRKPENTQTNDMTLPPLEDRFDSQGMIVDQALRELRIEDLNNDGRLDLITFGTSIGLQIRYQKEDRSFAEPKRIFIDDLNSITALKISDLNGDGRKDLLIARQDEAQILWNTPDHPFRDKKTITFATDKCFHAQISDINSDGIEDLIFFFTTPRYPLRIRLGKGDGRFMAEQPIELPPLQFLKIFPEDPPRLGAILRNRLAFRLYAFEQKDQPQLLDARETLPLRIGLEGYGKKTPPAWVTSDFNGDGFDDLLVTAPELSQIHLYSGTAEGVDPEPLRIDTLSAPSQLSMGESNDLLVVSRKEKTAAIHSGKNIETFPTLLHLPGDVLAGTTIEGADECWFVCKNSEKKLQLAQAKKRGTEVSIYPIDLKNEPNDLMAFRLPDDQVGLILFMPYSAPKMFLFQHGQIEELASDAFRALSLRLKRSQIRTAQPGDGEILLVSDGSTARRYEWKNGRYQIVHQFNSENPQGELIASTSYHLLNGAEGTLFYDRNASDLLWFSADEEQKGKIHLSSAGSGIFNLIQLRNGKRDCIILLDRTGLNEVLGDGKRIEPVSLSEYVSPSEDPRLTYATSVKLGTPPRPMVALVDGANRSVELVSTQDDTLKKELLFEVFLESDFSSQKSNRSTEPHDLASGDLNGDGKGDLVMLCQDKLLIYLGE